MDSHKSLVSPGRKRWKIILLIQFFVRLKRIFIIKKTALFSFTKDIDGIFFVLCSSRKNPYSPHGRSLEIPRGRGCLKG